MRTYTYGECEQDAAEENRALFIELYWDIRHLIEKKAKKDIKALKRIYTKSDQIKRLQRKLEVEVETLVGENVSLPMQIATIFKEIKKRYEL